MPDLPAKAVSLSCTVAGHSRLKDRSLTIRLTTTLEAPVELATWLDARHGEAVEVFIADDAKETALSYKGKKDEKGFSPSQNLRNGIYRYWNHLSQTGKTEMEFNQFYDQEMNKIIEQY